MHYRFVLLILLFAMTWLPGLSLAQNAIEQNFAHDQPQIVIAHRSAEMAGSPENSLAWIEYGIGRGVDMVHINPQLTADGKYVLMHDPTLNRTTDVETAFPEGPPTGPTREQRGGLDYVRDYTLEEIQRLHIVGAGDASTHKVPTLSEAIDLVDGRTLIALGLKSYEIDSLAQTLRPHDTKNLLLFELYFSGTDQSKLRELAEATGLGVGVALFRSRDYLMDLEGILAQLGPHLRMVSVGSARLTPEFLARVEELHLHLAISGWSNTEDSALVDGDDPGPWLAVLNSGYSAMTDYPEVVLELLSR